MIKRISLSLISLTLISFLMIAGIDTIKRENNKQMAERINKIMNEIFVEADVPEITLSKE